MRKWRMAALIFGSVTASLAVVALFIYIEWGDLRWLTAQPVGSDVRVQHNFTPEAPSSIRVVPKKKNYLPPRRILSTDGLRVTQYGGADRLDDKIWQTTEGLDQDLLDAVKDLKDAVGLYPTAADRVTVVPLPQSQCTFREPFEVVPSGAGFKVNLPVEPLALGMWKARDALSASLAVSILEREVPTLRDAPSWLIYGIALNFSDLGYTWERRAVLDSDGAPKLLIRRLKDAGNLSWADGYWALRAFSFRKGRGAVFGWIEAMRAGESWREALTGSSGESPDDFEAAYVKWTTRYLDQKCANRRFLLDQVAKLRLRRERDVVPVLSKFVEEHPLDWYAGNARYFLNYARFRIGRYDRAIEGFSDLLLNQPESTTWQGKAHYFMGRAYQLSGYAPLAEEQFKIAALSDNPLLVKLAVRRIKEVGQ